MPSAAAIASTVPPRSTRATSRTDLGPGLLDGVGRFEERGAPVTVSSVTTTLSPGSSAPAMRPPAPWSLVSLRTLKALSGRPSVAATPAVTKATGSAPMVSPPIAVASGGTTESTASATSTMASGRQTVCLESMNQLLLRPDLSVKSPGLHRMLEQVVAQLGELGPRRSPRTARPSPADHLADDRARAAPPPPVPQRTRRLAPASTTSAMPMPRLKTRSISSSSTAPSRWISAKIRGSSHADRSQHRAEAVGQDPGQVADDAAAGDVGAGVQRVAQRRRAAPARPGRRSPTAAAARRPRCASAPAQAGSPRSRPARSSRTWRARV